MNKQSFIERLNLHLDEELSAEESEELLSVIRENPEYQRIYVEYCKLFNACSQLGGKFSEERTISVWSQKVYAYGGMAAAVALLLLAARNLSPFIDGLEGDFAMDGPEVQSVDEPVREPLLVVDDSKVEAHRNSSFGAAIPASNDFSKTFILGDEPFGSNDPAEFRGYRYQGNDRTLGSLKDRTVRSFELRDAIRASTFDHEAISNEKEIDSGFEIRAVGAAFEGLDFDLRRAAVTARKK